MLNRLIRKARMRRSRRIADALAGIYGDCPCCGVSSRDHELWELASVRPRDPESRFADLKDAVARQDWTTAVEVREFRGTEDAVVYCFLRCPRNGGIALLTVESFVEMNRNDRVTERSTLQGEALRGAMEIVAGAWRRIDALARMQEVDSHEAVKIDPSRGKE